VKAITLWPEWAWAICALGKRVENREWLPGPRLIVGDRLAIHAGKHLGGRAGEPAADEASDAVLDMYRRATGETFPPGWPDAFEDCPRSAIVAVATVTGFDRNQRTGWDVPGAWHWRLGDVRVLPVPVPCRGAQGLWAPSEDVLRALVYP
jgi:hypothetical protein